MPGRKSLFLLSIILFVAFLFFSYLVGKETFTKLDFDLTVKIQDKIPRKFDVPFSLLSYLGSAEITGLVWIILIIYALIRRFFLVMLALFTLPSALVLELLGKIFIHHPAPPYLFYRGVFKFNFPSSFVHTEYSYPSGHMTRTAFLVSFFISYMLIRQTNSVRIIAVPVLLLFLIFMGVSRVYLAEHWSTDVIGGTLIGLSTGFFTGAAIPKKKDKNLESNHAGTV